MRVLFITERFPPQRGGVGVSAWRHARSLAPLVERLDVLHLTKDMAGGLVTSRQEDALGRFYTVYSVGRLPREDESLQLLEQTAAALHARHCYHLVHGFYAVPAGTVAVMARGLAGLPVVVSLRGNDVDRAIYQSGRTAQLLFTLRAATRLLCVSRELQHKAEFMAGRNDTVHTPNAVDGSLFFPEPKAASLAAELQLDGGPVLAFAGELRTKKGLPLLLDAMEQLVGRFLPQCKLLLIGGVRREEEAAFMRWKASSPQAAAAVRQLPYERDPVRLRALFNLADLFVFPSLWEGMPNAVLEAMACGKPVLASAVGGVTDVLRDGDNGFVLESDHLDHFAECIVHLLSLPRPDLVAVGSRGRAHVLAHHQPLHEAERVLAIYRELLTNSLS